MQAPHIKPITCLLEDRQGDLWLGTWDGLLRYRRTKVPPRVRLLQVIADTIYPATEALELAAAIQQVVFEFKGLSIRTKPGDLLYCWRLEGIDRDWQPPQRTQRAYYAHLPEGQYTFQVKAIDFDLNESEPATLEVTILPDPHRQALNKTLQSTGGPEAFLGDSTALAQIQHQLTQVGPSDMTVLILGETGTGKGVAARALHRLSHRNQGPFIPVECTSLPENLVESELFGHEQGSFTGANRLQLGKVDLALGGTLFFDEIGDLPLGAQAKLLRLLQDHCFERVGGRQTLVADMRFVAATNRDLEAMVAEGTFRQDLFFRLRVFAVELPPLRQRAEDIALLAPYFVERYATHLKRPVPTISAAALAQLTACDWPGNVRELEHLMERATLICRESHIKEEDLGLKQSKEKGAAEEETAEEEILPMDEQEKRYIERALAITDGAIFGEGGAAQRLAMNPQTLRSRMRKHGIRRPKRGNKKD